MTLILRCTEQKTTVKTISLTKLSISVRSRLSRDLRKVRNKKGSWIYRIQGKKWTVYCSHHQGIKKLGKNLKATGYDRASGEIEALEHTKYPVYGVQWHPEAYARVYGTLNVFKAFKRTCIKYRKKTNESAGRLK